MTDLLTSHHNITVFSMQSGWLLRDNKTNVIDVFNLPRPHQTERENTSNFITPLIHGRPEASVNRLQNIKGF